MRFPEFKELWKKDNLENIAYINKGFTPSTSKKEYWENGEFNWLSISDMGNKYLNYSKNKITQKGTKNKLPVPPKTLVMSFKLSIGKLGILNKPMYTNEAIANFNWKNSEFDTEFMYYYLSSINILKYGSQAAKGITLNNETLNSIPVIYPSIQEQKKIGNFLSLIDNKIELLEKKHKNKVIFKNEFFNNYMSKLQNKDCKKIRLDKFITILNKINKNNENIPVLSINNKLGFISQEEQFEDRNVVSSDTKNYKIVEKGDFAYNPVRINVGSISRLTNFDKGIISPMYIVFKTDTTTINPVFFENYIFTNYFKLEILKRLEGSVRLILSADSLKNIEISVPNINEQQKISEFLELLSKDIYLSEFNLKKLKEFKKGLLQKMFV